MAIHYLISFSPKSLQLPCCYLARTVTHCAESPTLPHPGKGVESISQVFKAFLPKRNNPDRSTGPPGRGISPAEIPADAGKQGLTGPMLQLQCPASASYGTVPPSLLTPALFHPSVFQPYPLVFIYTHEAPAGTPGQITDEQASDLPQTKPIAALLTEFPTGKWTHAPLCQPVPTAAHHPEDKYRSFGCRPASLTHRHPPSSPLQSSTGGTAGPRQLTAPQQGLPELLPVALHHSNDCNHRVCTTSTTWNKRKSCFEI